MRTVAAIALICAGSLYGAPKEKTPETQASHNAGRSVSKDSKKESPGEDLYAARGKTFTRFVRMLGVVTNPKNFRFRAFTKNEVGEHRDKFDTRWTDVVISAEIGIDRTRDRGNKMRILVGIDVDKDLNAAQFPAFMEGNLVGMGADTTTEAKQNWGGNIQIPVESTNLQYNHGGKLFGEGIDWKAEVERRFRRLPTRQPKKPKGEFHVYLASQVGTLAAIRERFTKSYQHIYLLTHGAARVRLSSAQVRELLWNQKDSIDAIGYSFRPKFPKYNVQSRIVRDNAPHTDATEVRARKNIKYLLDEFRQTAITNHIEKNVTKHFKRKPGVKYSAALEQRLIDDVDRILKEEMKNELVEGTISLGNAAKDSYTYEDVIAGTGAKPNTYGIGNELIVANCFGRGEKADTGEVEGVKFEALVIPMVHSTAGHGIDLLADEVKERAAKAITDAKFKVETK